MSKIIVTGGSRGIGREIVKAFCSGQNNTVAFTYNNSVREANELSSETGALAFRADFSDPVLTRDAIKSAVDELHGADILVNNAGVSHFGMFCDITEQDWQRIMDINLGSMYRCIQCVLPYMVEKKYGRIVNISSMWGIRGSSCESLYSVSKAGVVGLTKALAKELGPSGITVNCIAPGLIDTDMNACLSRETIDSLVSETPVSRIGKASDIVSSVLFFCSENSSFVTGQVIGVDGGF